MYTKYISFRQINPRTYKERRDGEGGGWLPLLSEVFLISYTSNFLMALSRFASIRGWPEKIYSDPGSQLVSVERELKEVWKKIERKSLQRISAQN